MHRPPDTQSEHANPCQMPAEPRRRARLWELPESLHAPLLGLSVSMATLADLALRHRLLVAGDEAQLLGAVLPFMTTRNPLSEDVQRHLEKAHRLWVDRFGCMDDDSAVLERWRNCLAQGEVSGPLWAACTHKRMSVANRQRIQVDIHTLPWRANMRQALESRRLDHLESENDRLQRELRQLRIRHASDVDALREALAGHAGRSRPARPPKEGGRKLNPRSATADNWAA